MRLNCFESYWEMVNIATYIIFYINITIIAETQQRHISETFTFNECPRHLSNPGVHFAPCDEI